MRFKDTHGNVARMKTYARVHCTVRVQPPGTPAVGLALLQAFDLTRAMRCLDGAVDAARTEAGLVAEKSQRFRPSSKRNGLQVLNNQQTCDSGRLRVIACRKVSQR